MNLIVILFCNSLQVFSADDISLKIPFFTQEGKYWCWAAVSQTLAEKKGTKYSQAEIAGLTFTKDKKGCVGREAEFDRIGYVDDALRACGIACHGRPGTLTREEVEKELKEDEPIAIRVIPPGWENAHFVIIYGVKGNKYQIWDPEHGGKKLELSRQEMEKSVGRWTNTITLGAETKIVTAQEPLKSRISGTRHIDLIGPQYLKSHYADDPLDSFIRAQKRETEINSLKAPELKVQLKSIQ